MADPVRILPEEVQDFLLSPEAVDQVDQLILGHRLPKWGSSVLLDLAELISKGNSKLEILPQMIAAAFEVDQEIAKAVAIDLAGARLLPISALVGDVAGQIMAWGGDLKKFQSTPSVDIQAFSAEQFVKDTLGAMTLTLPDAKLQSRLAHIMTAFVKGVRDREETKAVLMRSEKVGGLSLDQEAAEHVVQTFEQKRGFTRVDFVAPVVASPAQPAPLKPAAFGVGAPAPVRPFLEEHPEEQEKKVAKTIGQDAFSKEDAEDVARYVAAPMTNLGDGASRVLKESGLTFPSQEMQKRFTLAVDARLRDIRDAYETQALFESPVEKGGLALSGAELSRTMEVLERAVSEWQTQVKAQVTKKPEALASQATSATLPPPPTPPPAGGETVGAPKPVTPRLSPQSLPASPGAKPKVEDVKFAPRLAGPVEELHRLTLLEFRRLSKDPKEAAMKIKDKIDLLEEQGYEKKIQGVKAWRESPLNELYLSLSRDALVSGTSIARVAEARRAAGQETLTMLEVEAVGALNAELRF